MAYNLEWIKLSLDIFTNRKIKQIELEPNGYVMVLIWIKLLVLSAQVNDNGYIYFTKGKPYTTEKLMVELNFLDRKYKSIIENSLKLFTELEMISVNEHGIFIENWVKYQNVEGMEKYKERARERTKRYRDKVKEGLDSNVTVTSQVTSQETSRNVTVTVVDKEVDKNKIKIKEVDKELELETGSVSQPTTLTDNNGINLTDSKPYVFPKSKEVEVKANPSIDKEVINQTKELPNKELFLKRFNELIKDATIPENLKSLELVELYFRDNSRMLPGDKTILLYTIFDLKSMIGMEKTAYLVMDFIQNKEHEKVKDQDIIKEFKSITKMKIKALKEGNII
jgi:predicted phage replisome organizer